MTSTTVADARGLSLLALLMDSDEETYLNTETRKITLVEITQGEWLDIEWYGHDLAWTITRVTYRLEDTGYQESVEQGHPLWTYANLVIEVAG
jgi:hypothetical protein